LSFDKVVAFVKSWYVVFSILAIAVGLFTGFFGKASFHLVLFVIATLVAFVMGIYLSEKVVQKN
jgi:hypothetical protein